MRYSTVIASFLTGAAAGSLATFFISKKYFEDKADKEIAEMKEFFRSKLKNTPANDEYDPEKYSVEEILDKFCRNTFGESFNIKFSEEDTEEDIPVEEDVLEQQRNDEAEYHDVTKRYSGGTVNEPDGPSDEESYHGENEEELLRKIATPKEGRRIIAPYEVSLVEFEDGSPAFDHTCLTYYMADEVMLYDADYEKVDDVRRLIGQAGIDALNRQIAAKGGCFYICNKNFAQMYEVQVVDGSSGEAENFEAGFVNE